MHSIIQFESLAIQWATTRDQVQIYCKYREQPEINNIIYCGEEQVF
jgi:hypothetical protein